MTNAFVGLDLGTRNISAVIVKQGAPQFVEHSTDGRHFLAVVAFGDEERSFGRIAERAYTDSNNIVSGVKTFIGKDYESASEIARGLKIVKSGKRRFTFEVDFKGEICNYSPEELMSMMIERVVQQAERYLENQKIEKLVVCVPAHFTETQKQSIRTSFLLAGLENVNLNLVDKSTAAFVDYLWRRKCTSARRYVVVVCFGAGFFEATLIRDVRNTVSVLKTCSKEFGGIQITDLIFRKLLNNTDDLPSVELRNFWQLCDQAKASLSTRESTTMQSSFQNGNIVPDISRAEVDDLIRNQIDDLVNLVAELLDYEFDDGSRLEPDDVNELLLTGGSSYIPLFRDRLVDQFHLTEDKSGTLIDSAAVGAAIIANYEGQSLHGGRPLILLQKGRVDVSTLDQDLFLSQEELGKIRCKEVSQKDFEKNRQLVLAKLDAIEAEVRRLKRKVSTPSWAKTQLGSEEESALKELLEEALDFCTSGLDGSMSLDEINEYSQDFAQRCSDLSPDILK